MARGNPALILILSNALDATAGFVAARLGEAGRAFTRINTEELLNLSFDYEVTGAIRGAIGTTDATLEISRIDAIYYRRPVPPVVPSGVGDALAGWMASEARRAWGGLLTYNPSIIWVNHPLAISAASYKPEQLARAKRFGFSVPDSLITNKPERARSFYHAHDRRVIAKPIGHGEVLADRPEDDRIVYTNVIGSEEVPDFDLVANCPTFFQQSITKEVDVRVTVVGREVFAVDLFSQDNAWSSIDCRRENMRGMRYESVSLPEPLMDRVICLVRSYGLLFGAIDLIRDRNGQYWFLELNPAGQWAWLEQLGYSRISPALIRILSGEGQA